MKTVYQLSPFIASLISHCYDSERATQQYAREIVADRQTPAAVKFTFQDVAATLRSPLERIERGIPSVKQQEFQEHIVDADPLIFKNIQYLYSRMTKEKKELLELCAEHILKGGKIEFEDEKVKQMKNKLAIKIQEAVIECVSSRLGISVKDILGRNRKREIVYARHLCIYLIKKNTNLTLADIGRRFSRDHTTAIHSANTIKNLADTYKSIRQEVEYFMGIDYVNYQGELKKAV